MTDNASRAYWTWLLLTDLAARGGGSTAYGGDWPGRITYSLSQHE